MKNILIIGASSGIGLALAKKLSDSGNKVFGTFRDSDYEDNLPNLQYHFVDILNENLDFEFLPEKIDGLVYCPGNIKLKPFAGIKAEEFLSDFNLQVLGAIKVIQAVLPKLKLSDNASVVLFSTVAVQAGFNFHSMVSTSKGAIEGLTRALAAEFSPTIRVNCIAPSITDTPLAEHLLNTEAKREANANRHALKKIGDANDIASTAEFLLSENAGWITGQVLHVDGGMSNIKI